MTKYGWVYRLFISLSNQIKQSEKELDLVKTALEQAYEGVIIVDGSGIVMSMNQTYASFINKEPKEVIGRHVTEVIENTRMHIVAKTGKAEIADVQQINGHQMIANRIPIVVDGKVIAVVGKVMFQDIDDLFAMYSKYEKLKNELESYKRELQRRVSAKYSFQHIISQSEEIEAVKLLARKVAKSESTVLISGESGTGKELFAHAIHQESKRAYAPFIRVNCAAIPESLFESELFGYKEGSFTGAKKVGKKGKFSLAHRGTLFLDEVSEMPLHMQAKLLRVLQEKEIEPVGAEVPEPIDVRIIAATNKDLAAQVEQGLFRQDLYYRLDVITLEIPPLRERIDDIPLLAEHLLQQLSKEMGLHVEGIDSEAVELLVEYHWPGNVRELRNILERALLVKDGAYIQKKDIAPSLRKKERIEQKHRRLAEEVIHFEEGKRLKEMVEDTEKQAIQWALLQEQGNRLKAAQRLGISKSSFYDKLEKYQLER
nr:sigma-54-dependent Fis family transcriptional regulator [Caldalkalibacillus mannanilyticus]